MKTRELPNALEISPSEALRFWQQFLSRATFRVQECNGIAGEVLWVTRTCDIPEFRFTVQSAEAPGDYIVCSFNACTGVLTCTPGPQNDGGICEFEWTGDALRLGASRMSLDEAVCAVLDKLAFAGEN